MNVGQSIEIRLHTGEWVAGELVGKTTFEFVDWTSIEYHVRSEWQGRKSVTRTVAETSVRPAQRLL